MSGRRAQFVVGGELYLLAHEWALPPGGMAGYVRVETTRAAELLGALPPMIARHPSLAPLLISATRRSPGSARPRLRGLVLLRRASVRGGSAPPEVEEVIEPIEWEPRVPEPEPAPVVELVAQATIAKTLLAAAANGAPFCEMCENCS